MILLCFLLIIILSIVLILKKYNVVFRGFIIITIVTIAIVLFIMVERGFVPIPIVLRQMYNCMLTEQDLYTPIISDNSFYLNKKGFEKNYLITPKYFGVYVIGFSASKGIYSQYNFTGKLKVEFFENNKLIMHKIVNKKISAYYRGNNIEEYDSVNLMTFEFPLLKKYKDNVELRLTVLEEDKDLKNYIGNITLYVRIYDIL